MLVNQREWDLWISFPAIMMPWAVEENPFIPASTLTGALRAFLDRIWSESDILQDIFGYFPDLSRFRVSDLRVVADEGQPELRTALGLSIDRYSGAPGALHETKAMYGATFRGTVQLQNGGVYPAVTAYYVLTKLLRDISVGPGRNRGYGSVETCRMSRSQPNEYLGLNPIEQIFRRATHEMIEQIAANPDLVYSLEWRDLERVIAQVFEEIGFSVRLTKASQDGGKDIVLYFLSGGTRDRQEYYVEVKHWRRGARVSARTVNRLVEISVRDGASGSVFLSTSGFSTGVGEYSISETGPFLGDLSTIYTLCRFYVASRSNELFSARKLEDIVRLKNDR